jgi:hypothetical protein
MTDDFPNLRKYMRELNELREKEQPNHKDEARRYAVLYSELFPDFEYPDYAALMQMHATLYLAEQQRIANLIAYAQTFPFAPSLRADIEKELGI